jgi:multiple sugar transport system substrate-binding protein
MVEEKKVSRRDYLKYTGAAIGGLVVGGALGYLLKPAEVIEKTVERTVTHTVTATPTTILTTPIKRFEGLTLSYMTPPWGVPSEKIIKKIEDSMGIKLEVISLAIDVLFDKVATASAAGQPPADVIFLSELAPSKIVAPGWLEPIDDVLTEDMRKDLTRWDAWKDKNGNLVGIVFYNQLVMLDYDAKKLSDAGFNEPPKTWDEFMEMSTAIKEKGVDEYPIVFAANAWPWYLMALSMGDPMFDKDLNPTFNQPDSGGLRAMKLFVEFHKKKLIHPDLLANVGAHATWWAGVGVFHQAWEGSLKISNDPTKCKHAPNCKYMLLPEAHRTWTLDAAVGVSKFSKNKEAAKELVKLLVSPDVMIDIWNSYGVVPARKSVREYLATLEGPGKLEGLDIINEQAKYVVPIPGRGNALPYFEPWFGEFEQKVIDMMIAAGRLQISPEQAVNMIAEEVFKLKKKYGE